jgi:GNAT superfamily N-acetyltransferase
MIISDSLAARLESAEALDAAACAEASYLLENRESQIKAAGGGVLTYCGSASPLTHALGIGMHGPVSSDDFDEIEEFFRSRDAAVAIDVCPHADRSLLEMLVARGYRISELNNVLVRALRPDEVFAVSESIEVRAAADAEQYASVVMRGFFGRGHVTEDELRLGRTLFRMTCATPLLGFVDGRPVGGCGISVRNGVASFYGDGVLSHFRRRGVHAALIAARLRMAVEAGCDLATAGTVPGSASQRNYGRLGFEVAYTKLTMVLA